MRDGLFEEPQRARELRPYQSKAIDDLRRSLASGKRRPVLQLPTGGGKTVVAAEIIRLARDKGRRVTFCVPALSLIDQTLESFWRHGIRDIGVIQADHPETDYARPVQIASVQTLARRTFPSCELVIVDECHQSHKVLHHWMDDQAWGTTPFIGLSATPWAKGLGTHFDDLIVCATTQAMIDGGYLSPFRVFAPAHPDLSAVRTVRGDYDEGDLSKAMGKDVIVADIVETWLRRGEGRPTLCFCVDRAHAKLIQEKFNAAGVSCGYIDAYTDRAERSVIRQQFIAGKFNVIANIGVLTTGVDWPEISCIIFARPTKSEMLFVQIAGRGLRVSEQKQNCLFLDHSDNHTRLGFVTDIGRDTLDDGKGAGKAEAKKPLPKECPKCAYLRPPRVAVCPNCGFKPEPVSKIREGEGELEEITPAKSKRRGDIKGHIRLKGIDIPHASFFGQLKQYAAEKNYKEGWAARKYRDAVGVWPNAHRYAPTQEVSGEVASWIKAGLIAWAKRNDARPPPVYSDAHRRARNVAEGRDANDDGALPPREWN